MKKIIVVVMFLIFVVHCSGCSSSGNSGTIKSQTLLEITDLKSKVVTKIVFIDGRGGLNKPLTVENKQKIDEFLNYFDKIRIRKADSSEIKVGWIYHAIFYNHEKKILEITFGNPMKINKDKYYTVLKNELSTKKIDEYLKSINSNWKTTR